MKVKVIITLTLFLIFSMVGAIVTSAALGNANDTTINNNNEETFNVSGDSTENLKDYVNYGEMFFANKKATEKLNFKMLDGTSIPLTYSRSTTFSGTDILKNIYVDNDNNEFFFDSEGTPVGFFKEPSYYDELPITTHEPIAEEDWISEKDALRIANMHISSMYGDVSKQLVLSDKKITDEAIYDFEFNIYLGKDNCIKAVKCFVGILYDGRVVSSALHGYKAYLSVEKNALCDMTYDKLNSIAEANARAIYQDTFRGVEISNINLKIIGGKHVLQFVTAVDFITDLGTLGGTSETFYYNIP